MNKVKHIIVTRLALKWRFSETKLSWDDFVNESIELMTKFTRPSLKNQDNQDFTLLSIVDESVTDYGNTLENEVVLKVETEKNNGYPKKAMINAVNKYISEIQGYDSVILTRLDRDDALRFDFIDNVQNYLKDKPNNYIDLNNSITYNSRGKKAHNSKKYFNTFVSPFVSTHEKIEDDKIKCISLLVDHDQVPKYLKGRKVNDLYAMQVIHGRNLVNRIYGDNINIDLKEYGFTK